MQQRYTIRDTVPAPVAQQVFVIGSGIAGGVAGFILAREFVGAEEVPLSHVVAATTVSAIFTFGAALILGKAVSKEPYS